MAPFPFASESFAVSSTSTDFHFFLLSLLPLDTHTHTHTPISPLPLPAFAFNCGKWRNLSKRVSDENTSPSRFTQCSWSSAYVQGSTPSPQFTVSEPRKANTPWQPLPQREPKRPHPKLARSDSERVPPWTGLPLRSRFCGFGLSIPEDVRVSWL